MTDETELKIPEHTHKVTVTLYSKNDEKGVWLSASWEPDVDGADIEALGYIPASYLFMQEYIAPAIEEGYFQWSVDPMTVMESPSDTRN